MISAGYKRRNSAWADAHLRGESARRPGLEEATLLAARRLSSLSLTRSILAADMASLSYLCASEGSHQIA